MENADIAKIFYDIADLLEIKGEDKFRIRSYRNAGLVIEGLSESLKKLYEKGEEHLEGIPGIGVSTRAKIIEILTTGKCKYHDELLKGIPIGMLEIVKISGVGPKKAALLYKELGVSTIEALEKAASEQKIRNLPGMGEVTEQKILKSISDMKAMERKFKIAVALNYANSFVEYIKKIPGTVDVVPSGSLRRWKETVGDIDILTTCTDPQAVMDKFVAHPDVVEVLSKGETKSTVVVKAGVQIDIRVLEKKSFGAALQYFTGSKTHNIALRDRAKRMGLKISEYGVFKEEGKKWVAGTKEEDVYKIVGLPWIPPELRENRGEIEAAEKGTLPKLIELDDIRGDLHVHTKESDGTYTLEDMTEAAMQRGYEYMAVTDHSKAIGIARGLDEQRIMAQMGAIDEFNAKLKKRGKKFRVLKASEVDIRADGSLDHPDRVLDKLDCVVASIHSGFKMGMEEMTARIIKAIQSRKINILAHPTGRLINERAPYPVDMDRVMDEAKKYNIALELNSYPDRLDLNDVHCRLAKEKGVKLAISTDSHSIYHLEHILYGIHTARRGWIEAADVINTRPLKEVLKFLKGPKS
ncbi:MAG: DNA polymerase/3'-5' exonuclease PolX [Deltaproteobacteria bacterium]|nr:DNA polymerase/3'-5' exonuclease PolX [Deltaproteobacteria bacterium]